MSSWQPTKQTESTKSKTRKSKTPKQHSAATAEHRTPPHTLKASELHGCTHKKVSSLPVKKKSPGASAWGRQPASREEKERAIIRQFRVPAQAPSAVLCCARHRNSGISGNGRRTLLIFSSRNKNSSFFTSFHSSTGAGGRRMSFLGAVVQRERGAEAVGSSRPTGPAAAPI